MGCEREDGEKGVGILTRVIGQTERRVLRGGAVPTFVNSLGGGYVYGKDQIGDQHLFAWRTGAI